MYPLQAVAIHRQQAGNREAEAQKTCKVVWCKQAQRRRTGALHLLLHQELLCQELLLQLLLLQRLQLLELDLQALTTLKELGTGTDRSSPDSCVCTCSRCRTCSGCFGPAGTLFVLSMLAASACPIHRNPVLHAAAAEYSALQRRAKLAPIGRASKRNTAVSIPHLLHGLRVAESAVTPPLPARAATATPGVTAQWTLAVVRSAETYLISELTKL